MLTFLRNKKTRTPCLLLKCVVPKNIHTPSTPLEFPEPLTPLSPGISNPFLEGEGGMDIFWNYTISFGSKTLG